MNGAAVGRWVWRWFLGAAALAVVLCGCGATPAPVVLPEFVPPPAHQDLPSPARQTLLPVDCAELLRAERVPALLALPEGSISGHTVLGVGSPSVGMLERVTCAYTRLGDHGGPVLQLRAQSYTDARAAAKHFTTNATAEQAGSLNARRLGIGSAAAVWVEEPGQQVLLVWDGRCTLTAVLRRGVVPEAHAQDIVVDLAQRVLPALAPPAQRTAPTKAAPLTGAPHRDVRLRHLTRSATAAGSDGAALARPAPLSHRPTR